jgi:large subunit ribosomal protein L15|uniref:Large ribosomal subunit protein uL15/eL18 domain-containing protein n=1 Tax=Globisporangium ultimum (strain ATCC 200006 / CBS 805.95 / DAOM BR144) TaxID=431595 RepID=K3X7J1_GLOUD
MFCLKSLSKALPVAARRTNASAASASAAMSTSSFFSAIPTDGVRLNTLQDNEGAHKRGKRLGRGIGSGKGKTSGRGHKGQKARSGGGSGRGPGFEGGQTPIYQRVPKRGFNNKFATPMEPVNLDKLQLFVDMGRLDASKTITMKELVDSGMVTCSRVKHGIKLLGKGGEHLTTSLTIEVSQASKSAIQAIEAAGGSITSVYHNRLALRALLKPHKFELIPQFARPNPKKLTYYTDYEKRGYLSPEIQAKKALASAGGNDSE